MTTLFTGASAVYTSSVLEPMQKPDGSCSVRSLPLLTREATPTTARDVAERAGPPLSPEHAASPNTNSPA